MKKFDFEYYEIPLIEKIEEAEGVMTYKFKKPDIDWEEGTNVHLAFDDFQDHEEKKFVRHLSIMNLSTEEFIGFTTRISSSPFKEKLDQMNIGDTMILYKLGQRMPLRIEERPIVLISMGVGIAAMKPMMETYCFNQKGIKKMVSITISKETLYESYLEQLSKVEQYRVHKRENLYQIIEETYNKENIYYVVGSDVFLEDIVRRLLDLGHDYIDIEIDKKTNKREALLEAIKS